MQTPNLLSPALVLSLCLAAGTAFAQSSPTPAAASPAKKELVAKLLKLQQPGIEALARNITLQPAAQMLQQAGLFIQVSVPPEKREALAKDIDADFKKYANEAVPLVRDRALKLAPSTMGKVLEEKLSEEELKQVIAMLESPAYAKYTQLGGEQQKGLMEKLTTEMKPTIDPKLKALDTSIGKRLNAAAGQPPAAAPGK